MAGNPQGPHSFASPWYNGGTPTAEIVSINDAKNRCQVRIRGYQDDQGNIQDEKLTWVDTISQMHSGIAGSAGTHMYFPGAMVAMSPCGQFIMGAMTGYDSDQRKKGADASEDQVPNTPEQVQGSKGLSEVNTGKAGDTTSKGKRNVTKTDAPFEKPEPEKVFDYSKSNAPFGKGTQSKFPDLKSIGIDKLKSGSDILSTIDGMDNNISGAIQAGTKIIKNLRQNGFGQAGSVMGGAAAAGSAQVASTFGIISFEELIQAILRLLAANTLVRSMTGATDPLDLFDVPSCLQDQHFQISPDLISDLMASVDDYKRLFGLGQINTGGRFGVTPKSNVDTLPTILHIQGQFEIGFGGAVANAIAYVDNLITASGSPHILIVGTNNAERLLELVSVISRAGHQAGISNSAIHAVGGGSVGQLLTQGASAIQGILAMAGGGVPPQLQKMMEDLNTFKGDVAALGEIMGGGASKDESLSGIIQKYKKTIENLDIRGFTK